MSINPNLNTVQLPNTLESCDDAQKIQLSNIVFDGTGTLIYTFNSSSITFKKPTSIRSLYFDARTLTVDALVSVTNGETFRIPFGKQGYVPLFSPVPIQITISSLTGSGPLAISLFNFKVFPIIW